MKILKDMRENAGLSQADVAEALNYTTPQFISNWERGVSFPPIKVIPKLAKLYKTDREYLFVTLRDAMLVHECDKINKAWKRVK